MFHPTKAEAVKLRITNDLGMLYSLGTVKLYLCWYQDYLYENHEEEKNTNRSVTIHDVARILEEVIHLPYVIRHNVIHAQAFPAFLMKEQDECETYIEISLIKNLTL